jgi:hypothetical protein
MKIVAVFNIYNEASTIREAIESATWCDRIIVVDGAFKGFPTSDGQARSNDGTIEIVRELIKQYRDKCDIRLFTRRGDFWGVQEKMRLYMEMLGDGDYFLRLNGDEIIESSSFNIRQALEEYVASTGELPLYQFYEYRPCPDCDKHYDWIPKMIKKTSTLKLTQKHLALTNTFNPPYKLEGGRNRVVPDEANIPKGVIRVRHLTEQRSEQRQRQNSQWLKVFHTLGIE